MGGKISRGQFTCCSLFEGWSAYTSIHCNHTALPPLFQTYLPDRTICLLTMLIAAHEGENGAEGENGQGASGYGGGGSGKQPNFLQKLYE